MWTADDLQEGDYIACKDEDDRINMHNTLKSKDIWTIGTIFLVGDEYRKCLVVRSIPSNRIFESEDYDEKM